MRKGDGGGRQKIGSLRNDATSRLPQEHGKNIAST